MAKPFNELRDKLNAELDARPDGNEIRYRTALEFVMAVLDGDHRELGSVCGEDACWLCAAQSTAADALTALESPTQEER